MDFLAPYERWTRYSPVAIRHILGATVAALLLASCMRFSPFQVDLSDDQREQTAKNLGRLATQSHDPAKPLKFGFVSDTHDGYENWRTLVDIQNADPELELVIHGGDLTDFGAQQEFIWAHESFTGYRMPFFAVAGNHDGLTNGRQLYGRMFGPENFSFSYGGVKFVFWNTNTLEWQMDSPDFEWLEDQVDDPATVMIVTHHPPDSRPHLKEDQIERLAKLLEDKRVPFYLYGHIHDNVELKRRGPTEFIKCPSAMTGANLKITVTREGVATVESCVFGNCVPQQPPVDTSGVNP